ncbi:OmpA family protein [Deinococcus roseus]|uniref:OmpA-like domain-containing protein n=1 Tax=Deinococcus roseus TaxID=392414 RepID=A0ABQ2CYF5_9DEIO|nr:OmpA family protein [Deinococcus roseus]GGJ26111.1 hypothetical protein GCM10008938_10300 [Deinococcus roseus]
MIRKQREIETNTYLAFSDLMLNLVFVLVFFIAGILVVGQAGWDQVRYRKAQDAVYAAITHSDLKNKPIYLPPTRRNDPPGVQRWAFPAQKMFKSGTAELSADGKNILVSFARVLKQNQLWKRIRIEGHTQTTRTGTKESWALSAARASAVADAIYSEGGIPSFYLAVAARGGQTPFKGIKFDRENDRVEVVIEYSQKAFQ